MGRFCAEPRIYRLIRSQWEDNTRRSFGKLRMTKCITYGDMMCPSGMMHFASLNMMHAFGHDVCFARLADDKYNISRQRTIIPHSTFRIRAQRHLHS